MIEHAMQEGTRPVLLKADALAVTYASSRGPVLALESLSAELVEGEFLSVLGPSGCGKSTLLKIIAGLLKPSSGRASLLGEEIRGPRRDVGMVFQQPTLLPWQNVLENVLLPIRTLKLDPAEGKKRALELIHLVGLGDFINHYPNELSGGMQQRVGIARGLVHRPSLLLMDEPFAALDAMTREFMMDELQRIWMSTKTSVVFITHSIPEAVYLSDRVVVLSHRPGKVIRDLAIELPRPRTIETMATAQFAAYAKELRALFAHPGAVPA